MHPTRTGPSMAPASWKTMTSSRLASLKDYVVQKDYKGTYDALSSRVRGIRDDRDGQSGYQWARQTISKTYGSSVDTRRIALSVEKVQLFPGWAVRRYQNSASADDDEFGLDVYVSGFASSLRPPEAATRSQKAFYRLAKGYAALPKLASPTPTPTPTGEFSRPRGVMSQGFDDPSELDLSKHTPTQADIAVETELEALEAHFRAVSTSSSYSSDDEGDSETWRKGHSHDDGLTSKGFSTSESYGFSHDMKSTVPKSAPPLHPAPHGSTSQPAQPSSLLPEHMINYAAQKLHANLDARLQPFWSSAIASRVVRLSIFCPRDGRVPSEAQDTMEGQDTDQEPLAFKDVMTNPQGAFQTTFNVPWERLATHPSTLHLAFGDRNVEYPVVVQAEMWAPPPTTPAPSSSSILYSSYQRSHGSRSQPHLPSTSSLASAFSPKLDSVDPRPPSIKNQITVPLSIPRVPVRVISDIDDTIKHAGILLGARTVFNNVFVRHLDELVVHSMVEWYRALWKRGVRFHYVSNSPFELLPVLTEFFQVSSLPEGSVRLKSYAARSLLPALLSPPAARKRQGVVEVLDAFPESRFILAGDTGEQDLELYVELAQERPNQIVGVFVRDVTTGLGQDPGTPPPGMGAGIGALNGQCGTPLVDREPQPLQPMPSWDSLTSTTSSTSTISGSHSEAHRPPPFPSTASALRPPATPTASAPRLPGSLPRRKSSAGMTPQERREYELQARIERACAEIPRHIAFRVFCEPDECVEMEDILDRLLGKAR